MSRFPIRRVVALAVLASILSVISAAASDGKYLIIDVSGGSSASSYSYQYVSTVPSDLLTNKDYKSSKIVLRRISAGTFTMGSPSSEVGRDSDETQHSVTLTKDFYMGVFEVTQAQYMNVTGLDPSASKGDYRPVDTVGWMTVRGRTSEGPYDASDSSSSSSFLGLIARKTGLLWLDLPTQAQWEYACRAGTTGALNNGRENCNDPTLNDLAWNKNNSNGATHEVGGKLPNAWALYDMHGNVWEWTRDVSYSPPRDYGSSPLTDPVSPHPAEGAGRYVRSGGYDDETSRYRSAEHYGSHAWGYYNLGFRLSLLCP
ncbi:MAG: formylglycine-generating enzyme family protein [Verrucomicrobia bacterium]|nr:formylglycine-generating enzyme family protein [Verrucomicrobiota bacterium]